MVIDASLLPPPMLRDVESDLLTDLNLEYDALGYMISGSPLSLLKDKAKNLNVTKASLRVITFVFSIFVPILTPSYFLKPSTASFTHSYPPS